MPLWLAKLPSLFCFSSADSNDSKAVISENHKERQLHQSNPCSDSTAPAKAPAVLYSKGQEAPINLNLLYEGTCSYALQCTEGRGQRAEGTSSGPTGQASPAAAAPTLAAAASTTSSNVWAPAASASTNSSGPASAPLVRMAHTSIDVSKLPSPCHLSADGAEYGSNLLLESEGGPRTSRASNPGPVSSSSRRAIPRQGRYRFPTSGSDTDLWAKVSRTRLSYQSMDPSERPSHLQMYSQILQMCTRGRPLAEAWADVREGRSLFDASQRGAVQVSSPYLTALQQSRGHLSHGHGPRASRGLSRASAVELGSQRIVDVSVGLEQLQLAHRSR